MSKEGHMDEADAERLQEIHNDVLVVVEQIQRVLESLGAKQRTVVLAFCTEANRYCGFDAGQGSDWLAWDAAGRSLAFIDKKAAEENDV